MSEYTAWNEPNHSSQPTSGFAHAGEAARYYKALRKECVDHRGCRVAAGDFLDRPDEINNGYVQAYRKVSGAAALWAYHPYGALNYGSAHRPGLKSFVDSIGASNSTKEIWLTEAGAFAHTKRNGNPVRISESDQSSNLNTFLMSLASGAYNKVQRFYYYNRPVAIEPRRASRSPRRVASIGSVQAANHAACITPTRHSRDDYSRPIRSGVDAASVRSPDRFCGEHTVRRSADRTAGSFDCRDCLCSSR